MESRASIKGHPIHPMLVVFPIGLWIFSFLCDLIYLGNHNPLWGMIAYYAMGAGLLGALAAAVPGAIDLFAMPYSKMRRVGMAHMAINVTAVILFAVNFWLRSGSDAPSMLPIWLSGFGVALLGVSGWLGGELVYVYGAGVNAPKLDTPPKPKTSAAATRRARTP